MHNEKSSLKNENFSANKENVNYPEIEIKNFFNASSPEIHIEKEAAKKDVRTLSYIIFLLIQKNIKEILSNTYDENRTLYFFEKENFLVDKNLNCNLFLAEYVALRKNNNLLLLFSYIDFEITKIYKDDPLHKESFSIVAKNIPLEVENNKISIFPDIPKNINDFIFLQEKLETMKNPTKPKPKNLTLDILNYCVIQVNSKLTMKSDNNSKTYISLMFNFKYVMKDFFSSLDVECLSRTFKQKKAIYMFLGSLRNENSSIERHFHITPEKFYCTFPEFSEKGFYDFDVRKNLNLDVIFLVN